MNTFLNISLLVIGTAATLAAFGGQTWIDGKESILKRIKLRGWISLACLALAFAVGSYKEIRTSKEDAIKDRAVKDGLENQLKLQVQVAAANAQEEIANAKLEGLRELDKNTNKQLVDTKKTLNNVQGNLNSAHDEIDRQGQMNLITALSNSDQRVNDVQFIIPFTSKGTNAATFPGAFLPNFSTEVCRKETEVEALVWLGSGRSAGFEFPSDDDKDSHTYFEDSPPRADFLFDQSDEATSNDSKAKIDFNRLIMFTGQRTINMRAAAFVVHLLDQNESAAHFLYPADIAGLNTITIFADTPYENTRIERDHDDEAAMEKKRRESEVCDEEVHRYFSEAFEKAYAGITLSQKTNLTVFFKLKALKPEWRLGGWSVAFAIDSKPLVIVNDQFEKALWVKWPSAPDKSKDTDH
jgi:hypothetical protein